MKYTNSLSRLVYGTNTSIYTFFILDKYFAIVAVTSFTIMQLCKVF